MPHAFRFITDCISSDGESINNMRWHDKQVEVSYRTMRKHCPGLLERAAELGYDRYFPLSRDWHVSYHRSFFQGRPCYYFVWSQIEQVFV